MCADSLHIGQRTEACLTIVGVYYNTISSVLMCFSSRFGTPAGYRDGVIMASWRYPRREVRRAVVSECIECTTRLPYRKKSTATCESSDLSSTISFIKTTNTVAGPQREDANIYLVLFQLYEVRDSCRSLKRRTRAALRRPLNNF